MGITEVGHSSCPDLGVRVISDGDAVC